jgi:MFS transporter, LPLT family, lysophospholipid transporter
MPPRFGLLIGAQFASALADNALLIVAIALLEQQGLPGWWAPLLKFGFTLCYVLLAPFVGPLADAFPKARVMAAMNLVKVAGVLALLAGMHPVAALAIVGFGAAAYAPAKYGLVTELVGADGLVAANAWLEITVVCAVLLGTVLGGFLICPWVIASSGSQLTKGWASVESLTLSLLLLLALYALASALNLGVPHSGARYPHTALHLRALLRSFGRANRTLWRDAEGGLSLAATTIFWGASATLQFAVLRWAVDRLGLTLDRAAYLQAAVAVGVVAGASAAGRWVPLRHAKRLLAAGVLLGLLIPLAASVRNVTAVALLLALIGSVGGFMVVPLNALLQHRGFALLTAGRSIAVQGFNENLSVLVMLAVYAALLATDVPIVVTLWLLGLFVAAAVGALMLREHRRANGFGFGGPRSRVR